MLPCFKTCRTPLFEQQTLANLRPKRGRVCVCEGEGGVLLEVFIFPWFKKLLLFLSLDIYWQAR